MSSATTAGKDQRFRDDADRLVQGLDNLSTTAARIAGQALGVAFAVADPNDHEPMADLLVDAVRRFATETHARFVALDREFEHSDRVWDTFHLLAPVDEALESVVVGETPERPLLELIGEAFGEAIADGSPQGCTDLGPRVHAALKAAFPKAEHCEYGEDDTIEEAMETKIDTGGWPLDPVHVVYGRERTEVWVYLREDGCVEPIVVVANDDPHLIPIVIAAARGPRGATFSCAIQFRKIDWEIRKAFPEASWELRWDDVAEDWATRLNGPDGDERLSVIYHESYVRLFMPDADEPELLSIDYDSPVLIPTLLAAIKAAL